MGHSIYLADDEKSIRELLHSFLASDGYTVRSFESGDALLEAFRQEPAELVILDIMMPGTDGLAVCRELRSVSDIPIILLTAKSEDTDKVLGLSIGADDYVTKPFNPMEVIARVRSQLRRYTMLGGMSGIEKKPSVISIDGVEIDDDAKTVTLDGEPVNLKMRERCFLPPAFMSLCGRIRHGARKTPLRCTSGISAKSLRSIPPNRATSKWCGGRATSLKKEANDETHS